MRWLTKLQMRIRMLFKRKAATVGLDDELRFHLDRQIAENVAVGMEAEEARYAAMRTFGNPALFRDEARATWGWTSLELFLRDVRYGVRALARTPGFAATAILVMALGIGANVALFTIVRSVLLNPLPFRDPDRLVRLYEQSSDGKYLYNVNAGGVFAEWKKQSQSFSDLALSSYTGFNLSGSGEQLPENVRAATFSSNLLPTLGVQPAIGRNFTADEDRPSANPTVLLSWGLWKRRFGGNPSILNQTVLLDAKPYTVVGVMPAWFGYPDPGIQLWVPVYYNESPAMMAALDNHNFHVIGRLKPGVTMAQGVAELSLITLRLHDQHRDLAFVSKGATGRPLLDSIIGDVKTPLYVLLAATGCVLLIACLNVANLLVARAATRRKELAVRTALGASRLRLLRQHLMESLLLSAAGGMVGLGLAYGAIQWFVITRKDMARVDAIHADGVVVLFTVMLVVLCAMFAGAISSLTTKGNDVLPSLQESSRSTSAGSARTRLRAVLLSLEVGLTVVLLIGAGLLLKSYDKLRSANLGCTTANVLKMNLSLPQARYGQPAMTANFFQTLLARVRALPGVRGAGLISPVVPGDDYGGDSGYVVVEHPLPPPSQRRYAIHRWVDSGYFDAIGIPILRGRTLTGIDWDGHSHEVLISESFARLEFPNEDPIGKHLLFTQRTSPAHDVLPTAWRGRNELGRARRSLGPRCDAAVSAHPAHCRRARSRPARLRHPHHGPGDRQKHHGRQLRRDPAAGLRGIVTVACRCGPVRRAVLHCRAAHQRDWHSHRAWGTTRTGAAQTASGRPATRLDWIGAWACGQRRRGAAHPVHALWNATARSGGFCRGQRNAAAGCRVGLPGSRVACLAARSHAGVENGIG
jgi:predicted permease